MLIKAKYNKKIVLLNTAYIVDVWDIDKPVAIAYILNDEREGYEIEQSELQKWLKYENDPQEVRIVK